MAIVGMISIYRLVVPYWFQDWNQHPTTHNGFDTSVGTVGNKRIENIVGYDTRGQHDSVLSSNTSYGNI